MECPLKISITHQEQVLIGQATEQSAFRPEEKDIAVCAHPAADLEPTFHPSQKR